MSANDYAPMGTLPWRFQAAAPGTLDILVDVQSPVDWEVGSQNPGRITEPLFSSFPVLTTRGNVKGRRGKFTWFIQDAANRDAIIDAIIIASNDATVQYYTWSAMDGGTSWTVQFDPTTKPTIGYLSGHRVVQVGLIQVATSYPLTNTLDPPVIAPLGPPSVSSMIQYGAYGGDYLPVKWSGVGTTSSLDFIGVYPSSSSSVDPVDAVVKLSLASVHSGSYLMLLPLHLTPGEYQVRMVLHSPSIVVMGTKFIVREATLTLTEAPGVGATVNFTVDWDGFDAGDAIIAVGAVYQDTPTGIPIFKHSFAGAASGTYTESGVTLGPPPGGSTTRIPVAYLQSGRKVLGPL